MLGEDRNARASLTQAASMTPGADALGPVLDYLISCTYSPRTSELLLLAGNNQGAVGCFPVAEPSAPGGTCTFAGAKALLSGGHNSVSTRVLQVLRLAWLLCSHRPISVLYGLTASACILRVHTFPCTCTGMPIHSHAYSHTHIQSQTQQGWLL